jgi:hypothetical protein
VGSTVHVLWWAVGYLISERLYYRRSTDGGQTWQPKILLFDSFPDSGTGAHSGQKYMAVDGDTVHVAYRANPGSTGNRLYYRRSTNNGASFNDSRLLAPEVGGYAALDTIHVAAVPGKVTIACRINATIVTFNSADGGNNFTGTVVATSGGGTDYRWGILVGDLKRVGDRIHIIYTQDLQLSEYLNWSTALYCATSLDGGANWSVPIRMTTKAANNNYLTYRVQDQNYSPSLAVDGNNIFVVWTQNDTDYGSNDHCLYIRRSGDQGATFSVATKLAQNQTDDIGDLQSGLETVALQGNYVYVVFMTTDGTVYLRRSSDSGATFFPRQNVGAGWWPNMVVDPTNGAKVHIFWFFTYRYSADGGATFSSPVVLMPWEAVSAPHSGAQMALGPNDTKHFVDSLRYYTQAYGNGDEDIFYRPFGPAPAPSGGNRALKTYSVSREYRYDCMEVASSNWFNFGSRMSAEVWVKPIPGDQYWRPIFAKLPTNITPAGSQDRLFSIGTNSYGGAPRPRAVAELGTTDGWYVLNLYGSDPAGLVPENAWTHLAMTYDAGAGENNFKLYKNGQVIASMTATGNVATGTGNFYAGNIWPNDGGWEMTELRLWSKALSQSEINANMRRKLTGSEAGLNAYYPFSNTAKDMTGHGNDGILIYKESYVASPSFSGAMPAVNSLLLMQ